METAKRVGLCALRGAEVALAFLALSFALDHAFGDGVWPHRLTAAFAVGTFIGVAASRWTGRDEVGLYKMASRGLRRTLVRTATFYVCAILVVFAVVFLVDLALSQSLPMAASVLLDLLNQLWPTIVAAFAIGAVLTLADWRRAKRFSEGEGDQGNSPKEWAIEVLLVALICALLMLVPVKPADPTTFEGTWRLCGVVETGLDATAENASIGDTYLEKYGLTDASDEILRIDEAGIVKHAPGLEWGARQDVDGSCFVQERTITSILGHGLREPETDVYTFRLDSGYLIVSAVHDEPYYEGTTKVYEKVR